jgi:predicted cupin superfamily sugar epimerase
MNDAAETLIKALGLAPLAQEGGHFRVIARQETSSSIWFLLTPEGFSALHRLRAVEDWKFQAGDRVEHVQLDPAATRATVSILGAGEGSVPGVAVAAGVWQGARLQDVAGPCGWALVRCTVTPAWDEKEFELGLRPVLQEKFPDAREWIDALTR